MPLRFIEEYKKAALATISQIPVEDAVDLIDRLRRARDEGRQVFLCGNGGSAATSSHFACELGKEASWNRPRRFRVISLADNVPWMTAISNDAHYEKVFVEQLKNYAQPGDLLIAFSTSGNSPSVVGAVRWGSHNQLDTVAVTGETGGEVAQWAGKTIRVPSKHVGRIQEGHFLIQHLVSYFFIEQESTSASEP